MNKELIVKECINSINKIFNNYNDEMIFKRIQQYICNQMPIVINNYSKSLTQKTDLSTEHDYFVEFFLDKNRYFYIVNTNKLRDEFKNNYFKQQTHKMMNNLNNRG